MKSTKLSVFDFGVIFLSWSLVYKKNNWNHFNVFFLPSQQQAYENWHVRYSLLIKQHSQALYMLIAIVTFTTSQR